MGMRLAVGIARSTSTSLKGLSRVAAEDGLNKLVELEGRDEDAHLTGDADVGLRRPIAIRQPEGHGSGSSGRAWPAMKIRRSSDVRLRAPLPGRQRGSPTKVRNRTSDARCWVSANRALVPLQPTGHGSGSRQRTGPAVALESPNI